MKAIHWVVVGLLVMVCAWIAYATLSPLVLDGHLYRIEQPVPVIGVTAESVTLRVTRRSLLDTPATCSRELVCEQVHQLPDNSCPIQKGSETFTISFPIVNGAQGACVLQGIVSYRVAGAPLVHAWKSEPFEIPERR